MFGLKCQMRMFKINDGYNKAPIKEHLLIFNFRHLRGTEAMKNLIQWIWKSSPGDFCKFHDNDKEFLIERVKDLNQSVK